MPKNSKELKVLNAKLAELESLYDAKLSELQAVEAKMRESEKQIRELSARYEPVEFEHSRVAYHVGHGKWYAHYRGRHGKWIKEFDTREEAIEEAKRADYYAKLIFSTKSGKAQGQSK